MRWGHEAEAIYCARERKESPHSIDDINRPIVQLYQLYELARIRHEVLELVGIDIYELDFELVRWRIAELQAAIRDSDPRNALQTTLTRMVL